MLLHLPPCALNRQPHFLKNPSGETVTFKHQTKQKVLRAGLSIMQRPSFFSDQATGARFRQIGG